MSYLMELYDYTYFPEQIAGAGKATYIKRNYEMIDKSCYCIFFYDENYTPARRKNCKKDSTEYKPKSGTATAYDYAVKKGKQIINLNT